MTSALRNYQRTRTVAPPPDPSKGVSSYTGKSARSPFTDQLPQFQTRRAYFHAIATPVSVVFANQAWYGLRRITPKSFGGEFELAGLTMTLLPTDSDGGALTGFATAPIGWGDTRGLSAAIVVGRNLPIGKGAWSDAPAYIPGISFGDGSPDSTTLDTPDANFPEYIAVAGFPTGKFRDTAPNKPPFRWSYAPHVMRFAGGDSLDVALVVRGTTVNNINLGPIVGLADVSLTIGRVDSDRDFTAFTPGARS